MTITEQIRSTATQYGVPPELAVIVATAESGLDPNAIGSSGEIGLFQIMPSTAVGLGIDPNNIDQNITGGVSYLAEQYQRFGSWDQALAAYNAGPGAVSRGQIPSSTESYVEKILNSFGQTNSYQDPTFSTTVYGTPLESSFPLWILAVGAGAVLSMVMRSRKA